MREIVDVILKYVLEEGEEEDVDINYHETDFSINIEIKLPKVPAGRLIGKGGAMASAIRTILSRVASGQGKQCSFKVIGLPSD